MIIDRIENAPLYFGIHPRFGKAFEFVQGRSSNELKEGRHEIDGKDIYALAAFPEGAGRGKAKLEAHRKYIDIQISLKGEDVIGWRPKEECRVVAEKYDAGKDLEFFSDVPASWFGVKPGHFVIFFPGDAHAPLAGEGKLHKLVVKVAV
jgi:YhcH/YjgK/YiaL family protein